MTDKDLGVIFLLAILFASLIGATLHTESVRNSWNSLDIGDAKMHHNAIAECESTITRKENCRAKVVILKPGQRVVVIDNTDPAKCSVQVQLDEHEDRQPWDKDRRFSIAGGVRSIPCEVE